MTDAGSGWPVSEHGSFAALPGAIRVREWAQAHPMAVDIMLACALLPLALLVERRGVHPEARPFLIVSGLLLLATLAFRRRFPLSVLATTCGLAVAQAAVGPAFPPSAIAVLIAVYTVAAYADRRPALVSLAVLIVFVAVEVVRGDEPAEIVARFVFVCAVVVAAFVLGVNVRTRRVYLASLQDRALRAERERDQQSQIAAARERALIAREMHDIVAHNLSVMIALADGAAFAARTDAGKAATAAKHVSATGRQALDEMHRLLGVLRSNGDESPRAPQPGIVQIDELVNQVRVAGLPTSWTVSGMPFPLTPTAELAVYRVAQEALTNVLKHAVTPSEARMRLVYDDPVLTLEIIDDGVAAIRGTDDGLVGHGLSGMRERVAVFEGEVTAGPRAGGGWRVAARLATGRAATGSGAAVTR